MKQLFGADRYFYLPGLMAFTPLLAFVLHEFLLAVRRVGGAGSLLHHATVLGLFCVVLRNTNANTCWDFRLKMQR